MSVEALKLEMVRGVLGLPDNDGLLREVADYIRTCGAQNGHSTQTDQSPVGHDPILDYIGGVSHGSLSANLDDELYGESPS